MDPVVSKRPSSTLKSFIWRVVFGCPRGKSKPRDFEGEDVEIQIRIEEPRIVAKVLHSDPIGLIRALSQKNVICRELGGGQVAVRLPYHSWDMIGEMELYDIPLELKPSVNHRIDVRFNCEEQGGALAHKKM